MRADELFKEAKKNGQLNSPAYHQEQEKLLRLAQTIARARNPGDRGD
jgi:hypothetical protein